MLKRYAACANEEEVKKAEEKWLSKIEKEWADSRGNGQGEDAWEGGNKNRGPESDDNEDDEDNSDNPDKENKRATSLSDEDDSDEEGGVLISPELPSDFSDSSDGEEMAEIRRRVLASKPFSNPTPRSFNTSKSHEIKIIPRPNNSQPAIDDADDDTSDEENDMVGEGEEDNTAFDRIIDATPMTDHAGIQRLKVGREQDRNVGVAIHAPNRWMS